MYDDDAKKQIKIGSILPGFDEKLNVRLEPNSTKIQWYICFNIALDEDSVSSESLYVTDVDGYIMKTTVSYSEARKALVISPLDSYEQGVYYILSVSDKVKSAKGQTLQSKVHIVFKLIENKVAKFKILGDNVILPIPKPRDEEYERKKSIPRKELKSKVYSFDSKILNSVAQTKLPLANIEINVFIPILGLGALLGNLAIKNTIFLIGSLLVFFLTNAYFVFSLSKNKVASQLCYNLGVLSFNKENYVSAKKNFSKALEKDPSNELAEYALNKVSFYLQ